MEPANDDTKTMNMDSTKGKEGEPTSTDRAGIGKESTSLERRVFSVADALKASSTSKPGGADTPENVKKLRWG